MILKCHICKKNILSHCRKLKCTKCCSFAHSICYDICDGDITDPDDWLCRCCLSETLPFYHYTDQNEFLSDLYSCINNKPMDFTVLNEYNLTPFEWNSKTTSPLFDLDPDMQFYSEPKFSNQNDCDYMTIEDFSRVSTELSIKVHACLFCVIMSEV